MKHRSSQRGWITSGICVLLTLALLVSVCLPLMGMRAAEPENPILQAQLQEIEVLQAGTTPSGFGDGEGEGPGTGSEPDPDREGNTIAPDPNAPEEQEPGDGDEPDQPEPDQPEPDEPDQPEQTPPKPDASQTPEESDPVIDALSQAPIGSDTDGSQGQEGEVPGQQGATDEKLPASALDLGVTLTWYKYGSQAASMVCAPGKTVGKRVLLVHLNDGSLRYDLALTGADAEDAEITGVQFAGGNGLPEEVDTHGVVRLSLPEEQEYRNYVFLVQTHIVRQTANGIRVETDLEFTFVLRLESGIDLDLQLNWQPEGQATCTANGLVRRTVKSEELDEGSFAYALEFVGDSADDAEIISAEYSTTGGEWGELEQNGILQLAAAQGQEQEVYYISVTAQVALGRKTYSDPITYTFVITYEDGLNLRLLFTWYEKGVTAMQTSCEVNGRAAVSIRQNQLSSGELLYDMALEGTSAEEARLVSASCDGARMEPSSGSLHLETGSGGTAMVYTILATAEVQGKTVSFTVTLRYSSDVRLEMHYSVLEEGADRPCVITCENKKTVTAEPVYDDQLTEGLLHYQLRLNGEDADGIRITSVECFRTGSLLTEALPAPEGSALLLLNGSRTGDNIFTVTAAGTEGDSYTFTINLPYKHRGQALVQIRTNLQDGAEITCGQEVNLTVEAWTEDGQGNVTGHITDSGTDTTLTVRLDGTVCRLTGSSGYVQQYVLVPENPEEGDIRYHELTIYAEDGEGNFGEQTLTLVGKRSESGQKIGTASIYIDMSILDLGVRGPIRYDVLSGEPVSYSIAKAIWNYDAGETFGMAADSFYWPESRCSYEGSLDRGFYLVSMDDGSGLGERATAFSGDWSRFGTTEEDVLAGIDDYFGAGSGMATLWRCIYRNGIDLSDTSTGIGEFDFTMGSGWMYSVGGDLFYPGSPMSDYYLQDGDTLVLRYTLAYGWDVGTGATGYGNSTGYCVSCINGRWSIDHRYETEIGENGAVQYVCRCCGAVQSCPHEHTAWQDQGDGTCLEVCTDCLEPLGRPEEHCLTCTEDPEGDTHTAVCDNCGYAEQQAHDWVELSGTATCTQPGIRVSECRDCGALREEEVEATGHLPQNVREYDAAQHWQHCQVCDERIEGSEESHDYRWDGDDWVCSVCEAVHDWECGGQLIPEERHCTCDHLEGVCSLCGLPLELEGAPGEFAEYHHFAEGSCTLCGTPDPNYVPPAPPAEPEPEPEEGDGDGEGGDGEDGGETP